MQRRLTTATFRGARSGAKAAAEVMQTSSRSRCKKPHQSPTRWRWKRRSWGAKSRNTKVKFEALEHLNWKICSHRYQQLIDCKKLSLRRTFVDKSLFSWKIVSFCECNLLRNNRAVWATIYIDWKTSNPWADNSTQGFTLNFFSSISNSAHRQKRFLFALW